jgi:outer membrane protein assembly factor BamE
MRKLAFLALIVLGGCQSMPSIGPYRPDVQQGNYVTQQMVAKLKPGMTRSQVRFALGAPLIVDPFHTDRWDYVYTYNKAGRLTEHRRIVVVFDGDKLIGVEGDVTPVSPSAAEAADKPPIKPPAGPPAATAAPAKPVASSGEPAAKTDGPDNSAAPAAEADKDKAVKSESEKGFFGRMLEKIGF